MTKSSTPKPETGLTKLYAPKPRETAVVDGFFARTEAKPPSPKLKITKVGNAVNIGNNHPDLGLGAILLTQALGTTDGDFADGLISQLVSVGIKGQDYSDDRGPNFLLAVIKGIAPRDEVESMLAAQMAAVHMATMTFARRLAHVENVPQQDSASSAFNKLMRTFAMQVEALKRYRGGGEQKVTVHHVHVNEGGKAIVGAVSQVSGGGGALGKQEATP